MGVATIKETVISVREVGDSVTVNYKVDGNDTVVERNYTKADWAIMMGLAKESSACPKSVEGVVVMEKVDKPTDRTNISMKSYGNLWVYEVNLPLVGLLKGRHKHEFDHMHLIVKGSAKVTIYDDEGAVIREETATAPQWLRIPKLLDHNIEALEDGTVGYCIHAIRNQEDEVVDSSLLWEPDANIRKVE